MFRGIFDLITGTFIIDICNKPSNWKRCFTLTVQTVLLSLIQQNTSWTFTFYHFDFPQLTAAYLIQTG